MAKNVVTNNRSICICLSCPVCKSIILISKGKKNDFKRISLLQKQSPGGFFKKGVLRSFAKFMGKHLCRSLFFSKAAGLRLCLRGSNFIKKRLYHRFSRADFAKWNLKLVSQETYFKKLRTNSSEKF